MKQGRHGSPGLESPGLHFSPGSGNEDFPVVSQRTSIVRLSVEKTGYPVQVDFDLGAVSEAAALAHGARKKESRFAPVGAKIGTEVNTGAAADTAVSLYDGGVEFSGTAAFHGDTSGE